MAEAPVKKKKKLTKDPTVDVSAGGDEGGGKKKGGMLMMIIIGVLMLALGVGAGFFAGDLLGGDEEKAAGGAAAESAEGGDDVPEEDAEPDDYEEGRRAGPSGKGGDQRHSIYVSVGKILATVEHNGATRYIQCEMDIVGYSKEVMDLAQHEMPAIRNELLMLFASQDFDNVRTVEGREKLRMDSLAAINDVLGFSRRGDRVEDAYFTAFVLQ